MALMVAAEPGTSEYHLLRLAIFIGCFAAVMVGAGLLRYLFNDLFGSTSCRTSAGRVLTEEAARELVSRSGNISLGFTDDVTAISVSAAKVLATHNAAIHFDQGVKSISAEAAEALAPHAWNLGLSGVQLRDIATAKAIARHRGPLDVRRIDDLPVDVVRALASARGGLSLCFDSRRAPGLDKLPLDIATAIASCPGPLRVEGCFRIDPEASTVLSGHRVVTTQGVRWSLCDLDLSGLTELPADVARTFSSHEGSLGLRGVRALTAEAATWLACHEGSLQLDGVRDLPQEVAQALARYSGKELSLSGLPTISEESATALAACPCERLVLAGLTSLSDAAESALRKHPHVFLSPVFEK